MENMVKYTINIDLFEEMVCQRKNNGFYRKETVISE